MRMCLCLVLAVLAVSPGSGDEPKVEDRRVTLELGATTVKAALDALFRITGNEYALTGGIGDGPTKPFAAKDVRFSSALRALCASNGLTWSLDQGRYVVSAAASSPADQQPKPDQQAPQQRPPPLLGMNRYRVTAALGKPDKIVYYQTPGREDWYYGGYVVEFVNCLVCSARTQETYFAVNMGHPSTEKRDGAQAGPPWRVDHALQNHLALLAWDSSAPPHPDVGYSSIWRNSNAALAGIPGDPNLWLLRGQDLREYIRHSGGR